MIRTVVEGRSGTAGRRGQRLTLGRGVATPELGGVRPGRSGYPALRMRTSPLGMRRRLRRAPLLTLSALALVVALGAACSDDGGEDDASPTTTSPTTETTTGGDEGSTTVAPDETTTTEAPEATEPGTIPGDDADVLTAEQAQAQLDALLATYRQALVDAKAANALDERTLRDLSGAFTSSYASAQLAAVQQAGLDRVSAAPPELAVSEVEVTDATATCAAGTAVVEGVEALVDFGVTEVVQPFYFRLEPAADGAAAPAWRIAFANFSTDGQPLEDASCA